MAVYVAGARQGCVDNFELCFLGKAPVDAHAFFADGFSACLGCFGEHGFVAFLAHACAVGLAFLESGHVACGSPLFPLLAGVFGELVVEVVA